MIYSDFLALDAETTDLIKPGQTIEAEDFPRLKQIGLVQFDDLGQIYGREEKLVASDAYSKRGAERVHGITDRQAGRRGIPELRALVTVYECLEAAQIVVGWNIKFDMDVLRATALRLGRDHHKLIRSGLRVVDLQEIMTPVVDARFEDGGQKWPSLDEGYRFLFGREIAGHHNAYRDAKACMEIFLELARRGVIADLKLREVA